MTDPSPEFLALLWAALRDPAIARRLTGRLRPRVVGRPHPLRRLPRLRLPGVVRVALPAVTAGTD